MEDPGFEVYVSHEERIAEEVRACRDGSIFSYWFVENLCSREELSAHGVTPAELQTWRGRDERYDHDLEYYRVLPRRTKR